jgi:hypothetical protein
MANHIPVITQDELDPNPPSQPAPTMTNPPNHPFLHYPSSTISIPAPPKKTMFKPSSIASKKRFVQYTIDGHVATHQQTKDVSVRSHKRKSSSTKVRSPVSKKSIKVNNVCKESRSLALTLHVEEVRNLMKRK